MTPSHTTTAPRRPEVRGRSTVRVQCLTVSDGRCPAPDSVTPWRVTGEGRGSALETRHRPGFERTSDRPATGPPAGTARPSLPIPSAPRRRRPSSSSATGSTTVGGGVRRPSGPETGSRGTDVPSVAVPSPGPGSSSPEGVREGAVAGPVSASIIGNCHVCSDFSTYWVVFGQT